MHMQTVFDGSGSEVICPVQLPQVLDLLGVEAAGNSSGLRALMSAPAALPVSKLSVPAALGGISGEEHW